MATHRVLLIVQQPEAKGFWQPGDLIDYDGPDDWKFEPLDPKALAKWEREVAQPDRVDMENCRTRIAGSFGINESVLPPGAPLGEPPKVPASGWQG